MAKTQRMLEGFLLRLAVCNSCFNFPLERRTKQISAKEK